MESPVVKNSLNDKVCLIYISISTDTIFLNSLMLREIVISGFSGRSFSRDRFKMEKAARGRSASNYTEFIKTTGKHDGGSELAVTRFTGINFHRNRGMNQSIWRSCKLHTEFFSVAPLLYILSNLFLCLTTKLRFLQKADETKCQLSNRRMTVWFLKYRMKNWLEK